MLISAIKTVDYIQKKAKCDVSLQKKISCFKDFILLLFHSRRTTFTGYTWKKCIIHFRFAPWQIQCRCHCSTYLFVIFYFHFFFLPSLAFLPVQLQTVSYCMFFFSLFAFVLWPHCNMISDSLACYSLIQPAVLYNDNFSILPHLINCIIFPFYSLHAYSHNPSWF